MGGATKGYRIASRKTRQRRSAPTIGAPLLARARAGEETAQALVLERSLGLIRHVAGRYRGLGLPMEDLMQEGAIGVLGAIETWEPERGVPFAAYAWWPVRRAISHAVLERGRLVRLPRAVVEGHAGPVAALAAPASLDAPIDESGTPLAAILRDESAPDPQAEALRHERGRMLASAVRHLPPRRRYVVERHFGLRGEPTTLNEVAEELHISRQRTREIETEALCALADELRAASQ